MFQFNVTAALDRHLAVSILGSATAVDSDLSYEGKKTFQCKYGELRTIICIQEKSLIFKWDNCRIIWLYALMPFLRYGLMNCILKSALNFHLQGQYTLRVKSNAAVILSVVAVTGI